MRKNGNIKKDSVFLKKFPCLILDAMYKIPNILWCALRKSYEPIHPLHAVAVHLVKDKNLIFKEIEILHSAIMVPVWAKEKLFHCPDIIY